MERTRFAAEIVEAIREKVSWDFPVIFRFSQWKASDFDSAIPDRVRVAGTGHPGWLQPPVPIP